MISLVLNPTCSPLLSQLPHLEGTDEAGEKVAFYGGLVEVDGESTEADAAVGADRRLRVLLEAHKVPVDVEGEETGKGGRGRRGGGSVLPIRVDRQPCTRSLPRWLPHHISSPVSLSMYLFNCMHSVPCPHTHTHTYTHTHTHALQHFIVVRLFRQSRREEESRFQCQFPQNRSDIHETGTDLGERVKGVRKKWPTCEGVRFQLGDA